MGFDRRRRRARRTHRRQPLARAWTPSARARTIDRAASPLRLPRQRRRLSCRVPQHHDQPGRARPTSSTRRPAILSSRSVAPCAGRTTAPARSNGSKASAPRSSRWSRPTAGRTMSLPPLGFHNKTTMEWEGLGADRLIDRLEQRIERARRRQHPRRAGYRTDRGEWRRPRRDRGDRRRSRNHTAPRRSCSPTAASRATRTCCGASSRRIRKISTCARRNPAMATACGWRRTRAAC